MSAPYIAGSALSSDVEATAAGNVRRPDTRELLESLRLIVGDRHESSAQVNADRLSTALAALRQCDEQGGSRQSMVGLVSVLLDEFAADVRSAIEVDEFVDAERAQELRLDLGGLGGQFEADALALSADEIGSRSFMPGAEFMAQACVQALGALRDRARNQQAPVERGGEEPLRERMH